jgi:ribosome biogenesis GTPase / thiamine phosphate phosphatase
MSADSVISAGLLGTVIAVQANYYHVRLNQPHVMDEADRPRCGPKAGEAFEPIEMLLCLRRSRLKKIGVQVMVGDRVRVEEPDWVAQRAAICEVLERDSLLDRPPVANADRILLVFALEEPTLDPNQLSRFLIKAESTGIAIQLALSKADLIDDSARQAWADRLTAWGYPPCFLSQEEPESLGALAAKLGGLTTIVAGPSGVGKSSLINRLIPDLAIRTNTVSGKLGRGRHTTRHVELFELPEGGLLADTPGFNQPDLDGDAEDLALYFPEIRDRIADPATRCQFNDCLHIDEPNCCVRGDWERYGHYLEMLTELQSIRKLGTKRESSLKQKSGGDGQAQQEPRLERKKFRQESRRSRRQSIEQVMGSVDAKTFSQGLDPREPEDETK